MKVRVKVKPNSRVDRIDKVDDLTYNAWVRAPAREGEANEAVIALLSNYFNVSKSVIVLKRGASSRHKTFEIL